jgi:hypothetical protein
MAFWSRTLCRRLTATHKEWLHALILLALVTTSPATLSAQPCEVPGNAAGTVDLPPAGCGYVSPNDLHIMIDGLPPGTTIRVSAEHRAFLNVVRNPGGILGGEVEEFDSTLILDMEGTGALTGFQRFIQMPVHCEVHTGPRNPGDPVQTFPNEMFRLEGEIFGDPDFDQLRVTAGLDFGLPSPGQTTLTDLGNGNWNVDSFFDISYTIEFVGAPGSVLEGFGGQTAENVTMAAGVPVVPPPGPCVVVDNGTGTVDLPPEGCGYVSPQDLHRMIEGLPPGTEIRVAAEHAGFFNVTRAPGGPLGGEVEIFESILFLELTGVGELVGFNRTMELPIQCEVHTGPRNPGDPVQTFPNDMFRLEGQIFGDPDFEVLRVRGGSGHGLPSPGQTTLTQLPGGDFNVDSFFDIFYEIDFQGAPGSVLEGFGGTTRAQIEMRTGQPAPPPIEPCVVADNGNGTANLPPEGCGYVSPAELHMMIDGLPPGTEIIVSAEHAAFFVRDRFPDGQGGEIEVFDSSLMMEMRGTGDLAGFQRMIEFPIQCVAQTGRRDLSQPVQMFPNRMLQLQGELFGDPDFEFLRIRAGEETGLPPSVGQTTLTRMPSDGDQGATNWNVDSFFDIVYEIEFQGAPGSILGPFGGLTQGTVPMQAGVPAGPTGIPEAPSPEAQLASLNAYPNPFNPSTTLSFSLPSSGRAHLLIYDGAGRLVRRLVDVQLAAGEHEVTWDGRNQSRQLLSSGTYYFELRLDGQTISTQKVVMLK